MRVAAEPAADEVTEEGALRGVVRSGLAAAASTDSMSPHSRLPRRSVHAVRSLSTRLCCVRARESGDMYVQVLVETPQKLNKRQKELLQEFEQQSSSETHPEAAGFFTKVKDFLDGLGNRQGSA